jgi:hypothetical protein
VIAFANFAKDNYPLQFARAGSSRGRVFCKLNNSSFRSAQANNVWGGIVTHKQIMYGVENRNPFAKRHALQRKQVHFTLIGNIFAKNSKEILTV